jgi:hypothetical protein
MSEQNNNIPDPIGAVIIDIKQRKNGEYMEIIAEKNGIRYTFTSQGQLPLPN